MPMRPQVITLAPDDADADGVAASQTPAAGGEQELTIGGALASGGVATMDVAREISITSAGDDSGRTFTVTGTNHHGDTIIEAVTGANAGAATTTLQFKTVTSVTTDDDTAGAVTVGTTQVVASAWWPVDRLDWNGLSLGVEVSGTANYDVQHTFDDIFDLAVARPQTAADIPTVIDHDTLANLSVNSDGAYEYPPRAVRLALNSFSTGASVKLTIIPASNAARGE